MKIDWDNVIATAIQTAMRTAVPPIPAAERIPGLTARIYAIVINIVSPAEARF